MIRRVLSLFLCLAATLGVAAAQTPPRVFDVIAYGAKGDGVAIETDAINKAIDAAAAAGGGTVWFPPGKYQSFSIRLKSNISLYFDQGSTLIAAAAGEAGSYDEPEPNETGQYQDFGHSHWHNSLIWGENIENVSITGPGRIDGTNGLTRGEPRRRGGQTAVVANKAIALKLARNVTIRDVSFLMCGHFCVLATGVDNLTIDNVRMDTNRDGINIDSCRHVAISNAMVNSPNDDAIVIKSTHALGFARAVENLTITNSQVMGFDPGTFLNGTYGTTQEFAPDRGGVTGRIKFGTESEAGFKNVAVSNVVFVHCRGLALETVDGAILEDFTISNITMRDIVNAPFFLRVGRRMRAPEGKQIGKLRRVIISNVTVYDADPKYSSLIMGIPGHPVEDVEFNNIRIHVRGGAPAEQASREVPELEDGYPDPRMYQPIPAYGFFVRHARDIEFNNVQISYENQDPRPAFILDDVQGVEFNHVKAQKTEGVPTFVLKNVENFRRHQTPAGSADQYIEKTAQQEF